MIVVTSSLQRKITLHGIEDVSKLATNTSGNLKRMNASSRESDSVLNRVGVLKNELDKVAPNEEGSVGIEIDPHIGRIWVTVLQAYKRRAVRVERSATQIDMDIGSPSYAEAAEKLNGQLHEQLDLEVQTLDSIVAKDASTDEPKAAADEGLGVGSHTPADPRSRRGPVPAKPGAKKKWDKHPANRKKGDKRQMHMGEQPPTNGGADEVQEHRDGPANPEDVEPIKAD